MGIWKLAVAVADLLVLPNPGNGEESFTQKIPTSGFSGRSSPEAQHHPGISVLPSVCCRISCLQYVILSPNLPPDSNRHPHSRCKEGGGAKGRCPELSQCQGWACLKPTQRAPFTVRAIPLCKGHWKTLSFYLTSGQSGQNQGSVSKEGYRMDSEWELGLFVKRWKEMVVLNRRHCTD